MTTNSINVNWVIAAAVAALIIFVVFRSRNGGPRHDREALLQESRRAATEAVRQSADEIKDAVVATYQKREAEQHQAQADKRKEASEKARLTKDRKLEELQPWREPFVAIVKRLAEPHFKEWDISNDYLVKWAEERANVYINQRPYLLQVIQSIQADAAKAAERYASDAGKSQREIMRQRTTAASRDLFKNNICPYCEVALSEKTHLDHIVPVQRGGPSEPWNLVFVCIRCNLAKRDLSLVEFVDSDYARRNGLKISSIVKRLKQLNKYSEVLR